MAELVESVLKAYRVLRVFGPNTGPMTVREISTRAGIPRSTCHALCTTLAHVSMLEAMPGGGYRLGSAQAWLGAQVFERAGLVDAARAQMEQLHRAGCPSVSVSQYVARGWVVFLHCVGDASMRRIGRLGTRMPAFACVEGQVVLASMSDADLENILAPSDASRLAVDAPPPQSRAALSALFAQACDQGYLASDQAGSPWRTVAAPIRGFGGEGVGSLSVTFSRQTLTGKRLEDVAERLRASADAVASRVPVLSLP